MSKFDHFIIRNSLFNILRFTFMTQKRIGRGEEFVQANCEIPYYGNSPITRARRTARFICLCCFAVAPVRRAGMIFP